MHFCYANLNPSYSSYLYHEERENGEGRETQRGEDRGKVGRSGMGIKGGEVRIVGRERAKNREMRGKRVR